MDQESGERFIGLEHHYAVAQSHGIYVIGSDGQAGYGSLNLTGPEARISSVNCQALTSILSSEYSSVWVKMI